jgi:hypothetical protein
MARYDEWPAADHLANQWIPAGQPRATADDGLVLVLIGQHGDQWRFAFDLPSVVAGDFTVEPDPDGATLHVVAKEVSMSTGDMAGRYMVFNDLGQPLRRRLEESIGALLAGWPLFPWSERRCTFYH